VPGHRPGRAVEMDRATQKGRDDAADDPQPSPPHESLQALRRERDPSGYDPGDGADDDGTYDLHILLILRPGNRCAGSGYVSARYRVEVSVTASRTGHRGTGKCTVMSRPGLSGSRSPAILTNRQLQGSAVTRLERATGGGVVCRSCLRDPASVTIANLDRISVEGAARGRCDSPNVMAASSA
jgi:hypothetical protein